MTEPNLADVARIQDIVSRYCRYLDDGAGTKAAALFTSDATLHVMGRELVGRNQIAEFLPSEERERPTSMHLISNCIVDFDGEQAMAVSDWVMLERFGPDFASTGVRLAGRYRDRFERQAGDWRIAERRIISLARPKVAD